MFKKPVAALLVVIIFTASTPVFAHAGVTQQSLASLESALVRYKNMLATSSIGQILGVQMTIPKLQSLQGLDNPAVAFGVAGVSDYDAAMQFIDVAKTMRPWIGHLPGKWGGVSYTELKAGGYLDEKGWVKKIPSNVNAVAGVFAWGDQYGTEKSRAGRYVLTYEGEGNIGLTLLSGAQIVSKEPGKIVFTIKPNQGNWTVQITSTDPNNTGNYIRNISIVREDLLPLHKSGAMFNPDYLKLIDEARVIRFMGTMGANNSKVKTWSDQVVGADDVYSYSVAVPIEVMVRLANEIGADPWFNMPFLADDDYNKKFAAYVRDNLDPDLVAHVELSNEVWNWSFQQAHQSHEAGMKAWGLTSANAGAAWVNYMGKRSYEVMKIWTDVYGSRAEKNLKRIAPTQAVSTWVSQQVLEAPMWKKYDAANYVPPHTMFDVLSPTTYFGGNLVQQEAQRKRLLSLLATGDDGYDYHRDLLSKPLAVGGTMSLTQKSGGTTVVLGKNTKFTQELPRGSVLEIDGKLYDVTQVVSDTEVRLGTSYTGTSVVDVPVVAYANDSIKGTARHLQAQKVLADTYGLQMIPYEGGQHVHHSFAITVPESDLTALQSHFAGFVRSTQMAELYQMLWDEWKALDTGPFMVFTEVGTPSKYGSWGLRASVYDQNPRAKLIDTLQQTVPVWWGETGGSHYRHGRVVIADTAATTLAGTPAEDYIVGSSGADVIYPGPGNDGINGGEGEDTLILQGKESDYVITDKGEGKQIVGPDGTDYVFATEIIKFTESNPVVVEDVVDADDALAGGTLVQGQSSYQAVPAVAEKGMSVHAVNPYSAIGKQLQSNGDKAFYAVYYARQQAQFDGELYTVNYWNTNENRNSKNGQLLSTDPLTTALKFGDIVAGPVAIVGTEFTDDMRGRSANDVFNGAGGNDYLMGDTGSDTLRGGTGNDVIDGGRGQDTAELDGSMSEYTLTEKGNSVLVSGPDGEDELRNIELVRFIGTNSTVKLSDWVSARASGDVAQDSEVETVRVDDLVQKNFNVIKDVASYKATGLYGDGVMVYSVNRYSALGRELGLTRQVPGYHVHQDTMQVTFNNRILRPSYWTVDENKISESSTEKITDSAITTALLFGDIIVGSALMEGTEFEDDMRGREHDDNFDPGLGNDIVLGGTGDDTLHVNGKKSEYKVMAVTDWYQYLVVGPDGSDRVSDIEYIHFKADDEKISLKELVALGYSPTNVLGAQVYNGQEYIASEIDFSQFIQF